MDYLEALHAHQKKQKFQLPNHGDSTYRGNTHDGKGIIDTLGQKEAELICVICATHFLATLASIQDPTTIKIWPGHKAMPD